MSSQEGHRCVELGAGEGVVKPEPLRRRRTPSLNERDRRFARTAVVTVRIIGSIDRR
jgi:hypothetical protein